MFWHEVFQYWSEINFSQEILTFEDVVNEPILLNSHVKIHKKVFIAKHLWIEICLVFQIF